MQAPVFMAHHRWMGESKETGKQMSKVLSDGGECGEAKEARRFGRECRGAGVARRWHIL